MADCCEDKSCALEALRERQSSTLKIVLGDQCGHVSGRAVVRIFARSTALLSDSLDNLGERSHLWPQLIRRAARPRAKSQGGALQGGLILAAALSCSAVAYRVAVPAQPIFEAMAS